MDPKILVNKMHSIKEHQMTGRLFLITKAVDDQEVLIDRRAYQAFLLLKKSLQKQNMEIGIDGAYRSVRRQKELYFEMKQKYGKDYADQFVAFPNHSEHHTGLAIDLSIKKDDWIFDNEAFCHCEKELEVIHQQLATFGFILRYPKGKEEITGYPYEPWHIRYVGLKLARYLKRKDLTLEEYWKMRSSFGKSN